MSDSTALPVIDLADFDAPETRDAALDRLRTVTHEIGFARGVGDRVVFMDGGVVVEQGRPADVLDNPQHPRTREFLSKVL